ncbi:MAG: hypothetical protein GF317_03285 [Candidatus Lokiarchaeota archaeon]|nr:hypothetical protein [Candidatus Lokiarchaeota archaeon]MBD3198927.1 hypothetical protein [Candidatus Lokiarchaeota archaeon]
MSKKLIFLGPPGVGKTTMKKIFFEGENSSKLLNYALEPTFGEDSMIFRLFEEDIGVFDLAGQENKRWLETEDKNVFNNTDILIIIVEIQQEIEEIKEFLNKVMKIHERLTPSGEVYLLIHKIDLIDPMEMNSYRNRLNEEIRDMNLTKIYFTSIKSQYFTKTFTYLLEILNSCLTEDISFSLIETDLLSEVLRFLFYLNRDLVISKKEMQIKMNLTRSAMDRLIEYLISKNHIELSEVKTENLISLTDLGKKNFQYLKEHFPIDNIYKFENDLIRPEFPTIENIPSFIGFFMADKNGRTFLNMEIYEGALKDFLSDAEAPEDRPLEIELIPMFISALEKFSQEINIKNLSGFNLKGINLKLHIESFNDYTVTFFLNPDVNIESMQYEMKNYLLDFFTKYEKEFESFETTGSVSDNEEMKSEIKDWLEKLNEMYDTKIKSYETFDLEIAEGMYDDLDGLQEDIHREFSILTEKIKKLKVNLMKGILDEDLNLIKKISDNMQKIKYKYLS